MSYARDQIHAWGDCEDGGSDECVRLHDLLNQVEDDRAHAEAEKLREKAKRVESSSMMHVDPVVAVHTAGVLRTAAESVDPYEERDGQLVRKSDGKPVNL
jgi:hypothetical protein